MKSFVLTACLFFVGPHAWAQTPPSAASPSPAPPLLLSEFKPRAMFHAAVHEVSRAKFPVIDIHQHVNDARGSWPDHIPMPALVQMMDACNMKTLVILTSGWGTKLDHVLDEMVRPYPGRFIAFTQVDWSRIDEPGFGEAMAAQIRDSVRRGARGLKVLKELGLEVRDKSGHLVRVDDPRLDPIWAECGRLKIPVAIHISDPEAFFQPLDATNERYEELQRNPGWHFYGKDYPTKQELLDARDRVFARHPETTFISLHIANWPENLDYVSALLDRLPNVFVEFGARQAELGRQPRRARRFFIDYQDRILFGTDKRLAPDNGNGADMYRNLFRWLETADEYFEYWGYPRQGRWHVYGLELPDAVLEKVYHLNAEKIFAQFNGGM